MQLTYTQNEMHFSFYLLETQFQPRFLQEGNRSTGPYTLRRKEPTIRYKDSIEYSRQFNKKHVKSKVV